MVRPPLVIRNAQLDAMREALQFPSGWERAPRMIDDLEDLGVFTRGTPELEALLEEFRGRLPLARGADSAWTLRTLVAGEIERAESFGINATHLLLGFVGASFRHGLDWARDAAVLEILNRRDLDAQIRLAEVQRVWQRRSRERGP